MQHFLDELNANPAYRHLLINHLPILGLAVGTLTLFIAMLLGRRIAQVPALIVIFLMALSALPVHRTGEQAYKQVRQAADEAGADWLDLHSDRAAVGLPVFYVLAGIALIALVVPLKWPKSGLPLSGITLLAAIACIGTGGWIAQAGGPIMHVELRPPLPAEDLDAALPTDPDP